MNASQENQDAQLQELKALTVRLPDILHRRIQAAVNQRKEAGERKLSMADWMIEAARLRLDGAPMPSAAVVAPEVHAPLPGGSAAAVLAKLRPELAAHLQVGIPEPGTFTVVDAEKDDEQHRRDFVKEFGPAAPRFFKDRGFMRLPSWPKKFEAAREQQEREVGS